MKFYVRIHTIRIEIIKTDSVPFFRPSFSSPLLLLPCFLSLFLALHLCTYDRLRWRPWRIRRACHWRCRWWYCRSFLRNSSGFCPFWIWRQKRNWNQRRLLRWTWGRWAPAGCSNCWYSILRRLGVHRHVGYPHVHREDHWTPSKRGGRRSRTWFFHPRRDQHRPINIREDCRTSLDRCGSWGSCLDELTQCHEISALVLCCYFLHLFCNLSQVMRILPTQPYKSKDSYVILCLDVPRKSHSCGQLHACTT